MAGRDRQLVNRVLEYCHEIAGTLTYFGGDEQRFFADFIMRNALAMPLQQIGELATHVSEDYTAAHGEVP